MKVRMLKTTNYNGLKQIGETHEVDTSTARRWAMRGIAEVEEITQEDLGGNAGDAPPSPYADMKAKALYELCVERGIEVEKQKSRDYYITALEVADSVVIDEAGDETDETGSEEGSGSEE